MNNLRHIDRIRTQYVMEYENVKKVSEITAIHTSKNFSRTVNCAVSTLYDLMVALSDGYEIFLKKKSSEDEKPYHIVY